MHPCIIDRTTLWVNCSIDKTASGPLFLLGALNLQALNYTPDERIALQSSSFE
jgi:hypothetical protein